MRVTEGMCVLSQMPGHPRVPTTCDNDGCMKTNFTTTDDVPAHGRSACQSSDGDSNNRPLLLLGNFLLDGVELLG